MLIVVGKYTLFLISFPLFYTYCRFFVHISCVWLVCSSLLWSALMCDTDQQCQSPLAVTPVPPKACKTPHISHITSLKSFILFSVLCDLTQWLFMPRDPACVCVRAHARLCVQGQVKPGLCYMITGLSLFSLHTSASPLSFLTQFAFFQHFTVGKSALTALICTLFSYLPNPLYTAIF